MTEPTGPRFDCGAGRAGVPFELVLGLPLIVARVDGAPVWLVADTGANRTVLTPEALERLGLPTCEADVLGVGLAGSIQEIRVARVERLELGGLSFGPLHLPVLPLPFVNEQLEAAVGRSADGVLGNDLMGDFCVTFDFPAGRLEFA